MKKLLVAVFMLGVLPAFANKIDYVKVPSSVREAFHNSFPEVQMRDVNWEKEKGGYEANFYQSGQKTSVNYDMHGAWLETERTISVKSLPAAANVYIEKNCKSVLVREAAIIKKANGETEYEARIKRKDYIFDAEGKFIKIEKD